MNIKTKISLQFTGLATLLIATFSIYVFLFSSEFREEDFYHRLDARARSIIKVYLGEDNTEGLFLKPSRLNFLNTFTEEVLRIYNEKNESIFIKDTISFKADPQFLNKVRKSDKHEIRIGRRQIVGILFKNEKGEPIVAVASAIDYYGYKKITHLKSVLIFGFCISVLSVFVIGWFFANQALLPVIKIINTTEKISAENLQLRIQEGNSHDELARLSNTINKLLDRLEFSIQNHKSFVANASHEMKTPLAVIKSELQVCLMSNRTNEEYVKTLTSTLDEVNNLTRLITNLLLLSQATHEASKIVFRTVQFDEMVYEVIKSFNERFPGRKIEFKINPQNDGEDNFNVYANLELLSKAFMNILDNAAKYSLPHQPITIEMASEIELLKLSVTDSGLGIEQNELSRIFEPFYRSSRNRHIAGHGIGLTLANTVVKLHKGVIEIKSIPKRGTVVTISLPHENLYLLQKKV